MCATLLKRVSTGSDISSFNNKTIITNQANRNCPYLLYLYNQEYLSSDIYYITIIIKNKPDHSFVNISWKITNSTFFILLSTLNSN